MKNPIRYTVHEWPSGDASLTVEILSSEGRLRPVERHSFALTDNGAGWDIFDGDTPFEVPVGVVKTLSGAVEWAREFLDPKEV